MDRVTINPGSVFTPNTSYYILLDEDFVQESASTRLSNLALTDTTEFTFTTNNVPAIISTSPIDDTTGVISTAYISVTFDIDVFANTGNIYLHKTSDNSVIETFDVTTDVSISGDTLTITPTNPFVAGVEYYVLMDSAVVRDSDLFEFGGISSTTELSFTTDTAPVLSSFTPILNATDTAKSTTVTLNFDQDVQAGTGDITIYTVSGTLHQTIDITTVSFSNNTVQFDATNLDPSTSYYINIDNQAIYDTDSGFWFAGISTNNIIKFTTGATPTLSLQSTTPIHYTESIVFTASNSVVVGSGDLYLYDDTNTLLETFDATTVYNAGTGEFLLNPTSDLTPATEYYVLHDANIVNHNGFYNIAESNTGTFVLSAYGMSNPVPYDYDEDFATLIAGPIVTDSDYVVYSMVVTAPLTAVASINSNNNTWAADKLTITGSKTFINSELSSLLLTPVVNYNLDFDVTYTLTNSVSNFTSAVTQELKIAIFNAETENTTITRAFTENTLALLFPSSPPVIVEESNDNPTYTIEIKPLNLVGLTNPIAGTMGMDTGAPTSGTWNWNGVRLQLVGSKSEVNSLIPYILYGPLKDSISSVSFSFKQWKGALFQTSTTFNAVGIARTASYPSEYLLTYTSNSSISLPYEDAHYLDCEMLLVAGGGGGGYWGSSYGGPDGEGGHGGEVFINDPRTILSAIETPASRSLNYIVQLGAGGIAPTGVSYGGKGGDSYFTNTNTSPHTTMTVIGGQGGAGHVGTPEVGTTVGNTIASSISGSAVLYGANGITGNTTWPITVVGIGYGGHGNRYPNAYYTAGNGGGAILRFYRT